MQVIAKRRLQDFWAKHPRSEQALRDWYTLASKTTWSGPDDVKALFGKGVDFIGDNGVIFDVRNNEFRLIVHIAYAYRRVLIKFVGTHRDYDRVDPETVS